MKLPDSLHKFFKKNSPQPEKPQGSGIQTDAKPPRNILEKTLQSVSWWIAHNKRLAALIAVVAVLLVSGGVYASLSDPEQSENTAEDTGLATNSAGSETVSSQNSTNSQTNTQTNKPSSGNSSSAPNSSTQARINGPIGLVGCSNSGMAAWGYHLSGGTKMWATERSPFGGGVIKSWQDEPQYFAKFDTILAQYPSTKTIWMSLCTHPPNRNGETDSANYAAALYTINQLKQKIPGVTIYASAINDYVPPHTCELTGTDGPSRMRALVDTLVNEGRVLRGPSGGSLLSHVAPASTGATGANTQTRNDGCHPNDAGDLNLGKILLDFFGA